jgi:hypothetical protein
MSVIHRASDVASEAVDGKAFHPHLRSTRIPCERWRSVESSTIHSTYYHY